MKVARAAGVYFTVQGLAVLAWWGVLLLVPASRQYFALEANSQISLLSFWLADLSLLGIGSLAAGWFCLRDSPYSRIAAWFVTGAISYAAIYCLAFALTTDLGWPGVTLMLPAMIWSGVFAVGLSFEKEMFRQAAETSTSWILLKTIVQIVIVWSVILILFPFLITVVENKLGIQQITFPYQRPVALVLFVLVSSIGVYGAWVMSRVGKGTPLPLDHAKRLVVLGPYAYVRNPMALSGVGQGLAVALFLGSPLVALYALMGTLIWQLIFRPLEENDLRSRFGQQYEAYCREVKCWIPRLSSYQIDGTADSSNSIDSLSGKM